MLYIIPNLIISTLILSAEPDQPTEIIGSAATPDGSRNEITVEQPQNSFNPFGYIAPTTPGEPTVIGNDSPLQNQSSNTVPLPSHPTPLISQISTTNPQEMDENPLDYQNKIENTIYQDGNRLLDVQSVPINDINQALTPNIQPTISNYPSW